ncbi:MAG TPA: Ppx/GppA phosphatase family protein [Terriglobales bacterium]|nr:Ppx/GppA phosphatase family protein [Terriglobales bacterium]
MPTFAAVDIGSNSVRIKIARLVRHRLVTVHEDREVTRLGKSVFKNGMLTPSAMARTVEVLQRFHKAAQRKGAQVVRVVATSALRDARNGGAFMEWVRSTTGWKVEIISGLEEGRLIHLGLLSNMRLGLSPVLMVDLGGGSCELTVSAAGHILYTISLPLGAVRLTEEFLKHDPPTSKELRRLRSFIEKELGRTARRILSFKPRLMIATSGTAAALAAVCSGVHKSTVRESMQDVPRAKAVKIAAKLAKLKVEERTALSGIGPRRAEIVVAGAVVFAELLEKCHLRGFRYSPLGLRDGLLAQMAADYDQRTRSRRQIESDRWDALLATGKNYRVDPAYAQHVRTLALDLFRRLRPVHNLPVEFAEWLSAAAMLHEVGIYINRYGWHRHAHYVIANSEIFGYTAYERALIAAIARYLGNSRPTAAQKPMKLLRPADRIHASKAIVLLRLARALNQSRRGLVSGVSAQIKGGKVRLVLRTKGRMDAELELWSLEKEHSYFREIFGRELEAGVS